MGYWEAVCRFCGVGVIGAGGTGLGWRRYVRGYIEGVDGRVESGVYGVKHVLCGDRMGNRFR
jgi:hypothetical protein